MIRRGLTVLAWTIGLSAATTATAEMFGLAGVSGVIWPTDLYAFEQTWTGDIDVAVLGSSSASFGLSPSEIDNCLSSRLDRETTTVNLARAFSTAVVWHTLYRDYLGGKRTPKVLLLGLEPEALNARNHKLAENFSNDTHLRDLPSNLAGARTFREGMGALRPLTRGSESLGLLLAGRDHQEARLRWLMVHHGGGQYCFGSKACSRQNEAFEELQEPRWDRFLEHRLATWAGQRFSTWQGDSGIAWERLVDLVALARSRGTEIVAVNMPLHRLLAESIPTEVDNTYREAMTDLAQQQDFTWHDANKPGWQEARILYVDPGHLNSFGSRMLSDEVCSKVASLLADQN